MKINTFKSNLINEYDYFSFNNNQHKVALEDKNIYNDKFILLYIYVLPKMLAHGFKVGMTEVKRGESFWGAIKSRINKQENEVGLHSEGLFDDRYEKYGLDREVVFWGVSVKDNNDQFKDHAIHREITERLPGYSEKHQEWFTGSIVLEDIIDIFNNYRNKKTEKVIYTPRNEQQEAIDSLKKYFSISPKGSRFLLNCKMRFGKCYTTYKYAEEVDHEKILILTFVPAVEDSWREDLNHIKKEYDYITDFELKKPDFELNNNPNKPYVVFLSLQNYLGRDMNTQATKDKIRKLENIDFDLLVLDEYHFGAWNERTQETIEDFDKEYIKNIQKMDSRDVAKRFGIKAKETIALSGTPFKALDRGEFSDSTSFTYSYFDEQKNKYPEDDFENPSKDYAHFPDIKIFGYNMANLFGGITNELLSKEKLLNNNNYFSLNKFFETKKDSDISLEPEFIYEEEIKDWLLILQGKYPIANSNFPYQNPLYKFNKHTLWLMPTINACIAMEKLLKEEDYFSKYNIVNLSGGEVGSGYSAYRHLMKEIKASEQRNELGTVTLTVNKLTLGVTVKPWTSIFVLKDLSSPEQYFQAIFRVQTPNVDASGRILKKQGNVYDFNIDRAAALLLKYAEKSTGSSKLEIPKLIVKYLPIYMNGNLEYPISEEVFYELAQFGYSNKSLSAKVRDIEKTTRALDDKTIADMMNDPECSEVIKRIFAHSKFEKPRTKTRPGDSKKGFKSSETLAGRKVGYELGMKDYQLYTMIDDEEVQNLFEENVKKIVKETTPSNYDSDQRKLYFNGVVAGYESGVNVPIKKMKCGEDDGIKFVNEVRSKLGKNIVYIKDTKKAIDNIINDYLNNLDNIPFEYRGKLMNRWYKESFRSIVRKILKPEIKDGESTVEDTHNVLRHILAKVFQFLYISVYRETTFREIFDNADPFVFHSAVGIKKEEFEILNKYNVFQERILDTYIHEFFVNESLGSSLDKESDVYKENYRNSFNWFGFGIEN